MAQIQQIDITPSRTRLPEIYASQGDIGRIIYLQITNRDEWFELDGYDVTLYGMKPSGEEYLVNCEYDGHTVTVVTNSTMTAEAGDILSELTISKNGQVIGSKNIKVCIKQKPYTEAQNDTD
jgi:hypothetical protein